MKAWLSRLGDDPSFSPSSPMELARRELSAAMPDIPCSLVSDPDLGEGYRISRGNGGNLTVTGGKTGIISLQISEYALRRRSYGRRL